MNLHIVAECPGCSVGSIPIKREILHFRKLWLEVLKIIFNGFVCGEVNV